VTKKLFSGYGPPGTITGYELVPISQGGANKTVVATTLVTPIVQANTVLGAMAPAVQALIDTSVAAAMSQMASLIAASTPTLSTIQGTLLPSRVGPVTDAGITYTQDTFNTFVSQKAGAGGPSAPVKNAAPTLAFTGGSGDVGENAVYTQGTYTGGTVSSRDVQVVVNGVVVSTVVGISNGASIAIPTSAGTGARQFGIVELANWAGGAAIVNQSLVATINAPGVPVVAVAPLISPSSATELSTLVPVQGSYTVNGLTVNNNTLTFTYRWTADWTLTGSLTGETSKSFTSVWGGTTGSYSIIFSDGTIKTSTLTNGSAAFSWTGAVTATTAVKVQLATTTTLSLNSNNVGHVMRYYETPTGSGGAGSEQQASNTVVPTDSAGGGGLAPGHRFLVSISAGMWSDYQTQRTAYPVTPDEGLTSRDAEAWVASIPASGGVTLSAGSTQAQIQSALNANSIVFLAAGTYTITSMLTVPSNKWLIGTAGATVILDATGFTHGIQLLSSSNLVNVNIYRPKEYGIWLNGNSQGMYKVSVQAPGYGVGNAVGCTGAGHSTVAVSCEFLNVCGGGDGDAWDLGQSASSGNHTLVDVHAFECDDDGFDTWGSAYWSFMHYCTAVRSALNTASGAISGNGNGFKLGSGIGGNFLNHCAATDNKTYGFNWNSGALVQTLRLCTASGNGSGTYGFTGAVPDSNYIIIGSDAPQWLDVVGNALYGAVLPSFTSNVYAVNDVGTIDLGITIGVTDASGYAYQIYRDGVATGMPSGSGVASIAYTFVAGDLDHVISAVITCSSIAGTSYPVTTAGVLVA